MEINTFKKKSLGDFLDFWNGKSIKANQEGKYPVFGSNGIIGFSEKFLYENKIILGRVGAYCGSVEYSKKKFWASDNTIVTATKDQNSSLVYTYYLLKYLNLNRWAGGAAQPLLTQNVIKQIITYIPSNSTQRRIAGILSAYDELIENNSRRIKILEEMARMLYQEWFVKFRFPGHKQTKFVESPLGMIPAGWEVGLVKTFGQVITGKTPSKLIKEYYGDYMPFIKTPSMHGNIFCINAEEYLSKLGVNSQKNKTLPPNTLIMNCIGALAGSVSITCTFCQTNQQINAVVLHEQFTREYLYFLLVNLKDTVRQYGSTGATMINLSKEKFEQLLVLIPLKEYILNFHQVVFPLFELIKKLQIKNQNLRQTRDMLLPKLISGEIDVSDLDISIEER